MIFLRAYSHILVQKSGAIQNPADIDAVDESGVRLSNEVGKLLIGTRLVHGVIFFFGLRRPCPLGRGGSKPSSFHRLI